MNNLSLYQKYRPNNFLEIIGQLSTIRTLTNSIKLNKLGHAYIFSGPKGIGKTTIAKIFSKAINCTDFHDDVCSKCESCEEIANNQSQDILELDAASNNGVDDIRNILDSTKFLPIFLKYKVYIIDEAHMLTNSAWNALLKTLEEPPSYVIFIFATTEVRKIPGTILSRCQCFEFSRLSDVQIEQLINNVVKKEKIKICKEGTAKIIDLSDGSGRDALSILEQTYLYTHNNITEKTLCELFGLVDLDEKISLIQNIIKNDLGEIIKKINEIEIKGANFAHLCLDIGNLLLDCLIYKQTKNETLLSCITPSRIKLILLSEDQLFKLISVCQKSYNNIKSYSDTKFYFQSYIFAMIEKLNEDSVNLIEKVKVQPETIATLKTKSTKKTLDDIIPPTIDPSKLFKYQEVKLIQTNKLTTNKKDNDSNEKIEKNIMKIMSNAFKEQADIGAEWLINAKNKSLTNPKWSCFNGAIKVILASKNGIIIQYNSQLDADMLNFNYLNEEIQTTLTRKFNHPMYVYGGSKEKLLAILANLKQNKVKLDEPDLSYIKKHLLDAGDITQIAWEEFQD